MQRSAAVRSSCFVSSLKYKFPFSIQSLSTSKSCNVYCFVFFSCKKGELFDYLTEVVTLSEKRTRFVNSFFRIIRLYFPVCLLLPAAVPVFNVFSWQF